MTALRQHIQDLTAPDWASLARRAAQSAAAAAEQLGLTPPAEVAAVAAMTEQELVAHRTKHGPGQERLSPAMQLVQADQLRAAAEHRALTAQQDQADADAAAAMARDEAARTIHETAAARERVRDLEAESVLKDQKRAADHANDQRTIEELRAELAQVLADAQAEVAAAREEVRAAETRAAQRATERTRDRAEAEKSVQQLREQIEKVTADMATQLGAAAEQVRAAETRAEQRTSERTAEREAAEHSAQEARSELERVRADSAAAVAEAKGKASGEIAAARAAAEADVVRASEESEAAVSEAETRARDAIDAAQAESASVRQAAEEAIAEAWERANSDIARFRAAADDEVARARQAAQEAIDWAKREAQRVGSGSAGPVAQMPFAETVEDILPALTIPAPPNEIRADTGPIEDTLAVIRQVDDLCWQLLQNSEPDGTSYPVGIDHARSLIRAVEQQAGDLSQQLYSLTASRRNPRQTDLANDYARDAADAYSGFLQRIAAATDRLGQIQDSPDTDVVAIISQMLDRHPWVSR